MARQVEYSDWGVGEPAGAVVRVGSAVERGRCGEEKSEEVD